MFRLLCPGLVTTVITPYVCVCSGTERLGVQPEHQTMWFFTESMYANRASREDLKLNVCECVSGVGDGV